MEKTAKDNRVLQRKRWQAGEPWMEMVVQRCKGTQINSPPDKKGPHHFPHPPSFISVSNWPGSIWQIIPHETINSELRTRGVRQMIGNGSVDQREAQAWIILPFSFKALWYFPFFSLNLFQSSILLVVSKSAKFTGQNTAWRCNNGLHWMQQPFNEITQFLTSKGKDQSFNLVRLTQIKTLNGMEKSI